MRSGRWLRCVSVFGFVIGCGGKGEAPPIDPSTIPPAEPPAESEAAAPPSAPAAAAAAPTAGAGGGASAPAAGAAPASKLALQVVTSSPEGFLVNSTLLLGAQEAILIDAQFTLADGKKVVEAIRATNRALTTVYVTHFHPDHYFGFVALKEAFPKAKLVALPESVAQIQKTWAEKVKTWKPMYKDAIPQKPLLPEPLAGTTLELDGEKLEIVGGQQGDSPDNSYVWIPSLQTVVTGDLVYDAVFPWTAETTPESRKAWIAALDGLAAKNPKAVVPGHQKPERTRDPSNVQFTKDYLKAFDEALAASKTPAELQSKIKAKYPDVALDVILKLGAEAAFKKPAGGAKQPAPKQPAAKPADAKPTDAKPPAPKQPDAMK